MKQEGQTVPAQDPFPGSRLFGIGGLLDLEIVCGTEMPTMSSELENISQQTQCLVLLLPDVGNVLGKSWWDAAC